MNPEKYAAIKEALSTHASHAVIEEPDGTKWNFRRLEGVGAPSSLVVFDDDFITANSPDQIRAKIAQWKVAEQALHVSQDQFVVVTSQGVLIKNRGASSGE